MRSSAACCSSSRSCGLISNKVSSQPSEAGAQAAGWRHRKVAAAVHDSEIPSSLQGRLTAVSWLQQAALSWSLADWQHGSS
ncbi:unnamed protein product [Sphagnum troendelagicum]|uniref:Uncharacterized protein n=1 Tax=Sphagnum troendelagicum TaxID=128251 RepID=A0ABP0UXK9_9BRYO